MSASRLPGKMMLPLAGATMLERLVERLRRAENLEDVIVATTLAPPDAVIADLCKRRDIAVHRGPVEDIATRILQAAGDADVIGDVPPDLAKRFEGRADITSLKIFPYCMQVFVVNTQQGPTKDPLVRQAISAVVNAEDVLDAMGTVTQLGHSLVYPSSPYYQGDAMKPYYNQNNPTKAKELLKKAGYKGEKIVLQTNSNYQTMRSAILVLAEEMKAAGMNVSVDVVDWTTNASNMQRHTGTWNVSTTGFCSNPLLGPQQWRVMFYTFPHVEGDKTLDDAYERFYTSLDPKARIAAWADIEKRVLEQAYMIKIGDVGVIRSFNNKKVDGFTPYYLPRFWNVSVKP